MMKALADLNNHMERQEKESKDARKIRREDGVLSESMVLKCEETGCGFGWQTKAGLMNHVRQRHGRMVRVMEIGSFCKEKFHKQGLPMHSRFCWMKPNKDGAI